jgi:TPR repeat protein
VPHDTHRGVAAQCILAALDADPALMEHDDTTEIEVLPISDVKSRLGELGFAAALPSNLRRMIVESSAPSAGLLNVLTSDTESIETKPLSDITSGLQQLGINYRAGLAEVRVLARQHSGAAEGRQHRDMAPRRFGWRQPAAVLAGAMAAMIVLLLADHALHDRTIAESANVSTLQTKTTIGKELEKPALTDADSPVGAPASDLVGVRGLEELAGGDDPQAQFALGILYATGEGGVKKSYEQSVDWWTRADALGSSEAREALGLATLFRDERPLPRKWANLVTSLVKDRASFEKLSAREMAVRVSTVANAAGDSGSTVTSNVAASDMSAERAWATMKDGQDVGELRAFAAKFQGNFYAELAINEVTRLLRFTSSFAIDTDAACRMASSYSLTNQDGKRTLRIWSLPSGRLMRDFSMSAAITGTVLLDGTIAVASDKEVNLFDLLSGAERQSIPIQSMPVPSSVPLVASADGKKLLLADSEAVDQLLVDPPRSNGGVSVREILRREFKHAPAPVRVLDVDSGEIRSVMSNLVRVSWKKLNCYGVDAERRSFVESSP